VVAVFSFFGILIGSTIIGLIFGLLSTLCWKYWDLGQKVGCVWLAGGEVCRSSHLLHPLRRCRNPTVLRKPAFCCCLPTARMHSVRLSGFLVSCDGV
jgi:hypothetical protein